MAGNPTSTGSDDPTVARRRRPGRPTLRAAAPPLVATLGAVIVWSAHWRGVDVPAQIYRVQLFRQYGWQIWDSGWYGGHALLPYSLLFPAIGAALGLYGAAAVSAAVASWAFDRILRDGASRRTLLPSLVFAVGTIVPVLIGQFPFLCGEAIGLLAVLAARRGRWVFATVLALACPLSSPVAGAFLVLVLVAMARASRRAGAWQLIVAAAAAALPIVILDLGFSSSGTFPFWGGDLAVVLGLCGLGLFLVPRTARALRTGILLYGGASIVLFTIPNALGGNFVRLAAAVAPALALTWWRTPRRRVLALAVLPLLLWQWTPAWAVLDDTSQIPASNADYYAPLLAFVASQPPTGRLEIPVTANHWEAAMVAPFVPLARGWERQTDSADNPLFYAGRPITAGAYHAWLTRNGIQWVALPDTTLDYSSIEEAALLRDPPPYLRLAWSNRHWRVWEVVGSPGIVSGAAQLVSTHGDDITLDATSSGTALLRIHYTRAWTVVDGSVCVSPAPGGWTRLTFTEPGRVELDTALFDHHDGCPSS